MLKMRNTRSSDSGMAMAFGILVLVVGIVLFTATGHTVVNSTFNAQPTAQPTSTLTNQPNSQSTNDAANQPNVAGRVLSVIFIVGGLASLSAGYVMRRRAAQPVRGKSSLR